jgi:hypothetical protein
MFAAQVVKPTTGIRRCLGTMLDESMFQNDAPDSDQGTSDLNRRESTRNAVSVEVVMAWHFNPDQPVRYRSVDLSETGMRLRSSTPLLEGMTGTLRSVLPEGRRLDRSVMVIWSRPAGTGSGYEAGLRFF